MRIGSTTTINGSIWLPTAFHHPGAGYDAACDVDHDGDVDIFDIQLTAGHWNHAGMWVSDNSRDHLGQTWTGTTPLRLTGS